MRPALDRDELDLLQRWCGLALIGENLAQKIVAFCFFCSPHCKAKVVPIGRNDASDGYEVDVPTPKLRSTLRVRRVLAVMSLVNHDCVRVRSRNDLPKR